MHIFSICANNHYEGSGIQKQSVGNMLYLLNLARHYKRIIVGNGKDEWAISHRTYDDYLLDSIVAKRFNSGTAVQNPFNTDPFSILLR
jgi:hypothetical protein